MSYYAKAFRPFRDPAATGATNSATFIDAFARMLDKTIVRGDIQSPVCHVTTPLDSLAYRFDIVIRGARATWFESRVQQDDPMQRE